MKNFLISFFTTIAIIAIVGVCYYESSKNDDAGIESVTTDPMLTPEENAENLLNFQKEIVNQNYVDSVYISIPEKVLLKIALDYPDLTQEGIVQEYVKNKQYYKTWLYQETMLNKVLKKKKPETESDSIPKKNEPDKTLNAI